MRSRVGRRVTNQVPVECSRVPLVEFSRCEGCKITTRTERKEGIVKGLNEEARERSHLSYILRGQYPSAIGRM